MGEKVATKTDAIKCPSCGAPVSLAGGRTEDFCGYCGARVVAEKTNEHVVRHIDEAEVKHAETEAAVRLKELEMEQQRRELEERRRPVQSMINGILVVAMLACFGLGMSGASIGLIGAGVILAWVLLFRVAMSSDFNKKGGE